MKKHKDLRFLPYERLDPDGITKSIICLDGEMVLVRSSFNWRLNSNPIPNGREGIPMENLCEDWGWEIVEKYGDHIAIVREKS